MEFDPSGETGYADSPSDFFAVWQCNRCGYWSIAGEEGELTDAWGEPLVRIPRRFFE